MKKFIMVFLMSAAWFSPASAEERTYCHPSTGNWLNAATMDCAPSGKNDTVEDIKAPVSTQPPEEHGCNGDGRCGGNQDDGKGDQDNDGEDGDQDDGSGNQDDGSGDQDDGNGDQDDGSGDQDNDGEDGDQDGEGNEE